jgi:hypothetical protein
VQRITIADILGDEWFKKDYKQPHFEQNEDGRLEDVDVAPVPMPLAKTSTRASLASLCIGKMSCHWPWGKKAKHDHEASSRNWETFYS